MASTNRNKQAVIQQRIHALEAELADLRQLKNLTECRISARGKAIL